jgi:hypothetical protein
MGEGPVLMEEEAAAAAIYLLENVMGGTADMPTQLRLCTYRDFAL